MQMQLHQELIQMFTLWTSQLKNCCIIGVHQNLIALLNVPRHIFHFLSQILMGFFHAGACQQTFTVTCRERSQTITFKVQVDDQVDVRAREWSCNGKSIAHPRNLLVRGSNLNGGF